MRIALLAIAIPCATSAAGKGRFDAIADALARGDAPKTTSVLVMRGDAIEYERYFEGAGADTLHDTRSATKSLTSLAVGITIGRGELGGVGVPAFGLLADLRPFRNDGPLKEEITVEDLLTMSSALDCDDDDPRTPGNEEKMYPQESWVRFAVDLPVRGGFQRDAAGRGPFHYCTAGTLLLGQIVQRAARQPIDAFMAQHLFAPLGITRWQFARSPAGEPMTGGGLRLRTRDLARLAQLVRDGGRWNGAQVVPAAFVRAALTVRRKAFPGQDYGYLFWHRSYRAPCGTLGGWFMGGNGGNAIVIFPELSAVVVVTRTNYNTRGMHQQTTRLLEEDILTAMTSAGSRCAPE